MHPYRLLPALAIVAAALFTAACNPGNEKSTKATINTAPAQTRQSQAQRGEPLFKQYCSSCHPDGGNVTDPKNNLRRSTLKAKRINKPEDIIAIMRKPISRMISFDASTISDDDARAIADYILETF